MVVIFIFAQQLQGSRVKTMEVDESAEFNSSSLGRRNVAIKYHRNEDFFFGGKDVENAIKNFSKSKKPNKKLPKPTVVKSAPRNSTFNVQRGSRAHQSESKNRQAIFNYESSAVDTATKAIAEEEDRFISSALAIKSRLIEAETVKASTYAKLAKKKNSSPIDEEDLVALTINEGANLQNFKDLHEAVQQSLLESSVASLMQLLDWSSPSVKKIGSLCKVYWDGEREWFYARILNYDKIRDRHYVCFLHPIL